MPGAVAADGMQRRRFQSRIIMHAEIDISCDHPDSTINVGALEDALRHALAVEQVASAVLSVTVVDNATIHRLNREHLQHDYPTDVISFPLSWSSPDSETPSVKPDSRSQGASIEGEIVVSAEYAAEMAPRCGWTTQDELTLYAVHGMLHICGYDDLSESEKSIMRSRERAVFEGLGQMPQYPDDHEPADEGHVSGSSATSADMEERQ